MKIFVNFPLTARSTAALTLPEGVHFGVMVLRGNAVR